ncbi:MAG: SMP-30/gluconolactonase/LRE family protein [Henriciella sp.]|nr:SMP-30/gluconolactonase/LRE family protein [Henriciella sp.]
MSLKIDYFGTARCRLGESPIWDDKHHCLWWVDGLGRQIFSAHRDGTNRSVWQFEQMVGSIGLAQSGLIGALQDCFYAIDENDGATRLLAKVKPQKQGIRLNDGKVDPAGRFICGEGAFEGGGDAVVWSLGGDKSLSQIIDKMQISNSICFSPSGDYLYISDSLEHQIRRYRYDAQTGKIGDKVTFIDCTEFGGAPDGATVDVVGNLWVAMVLDQSIACFSADGRLLRKIDLPVPFPSCPCFGGENYETMFVTTISDSGARLSSNDTNAGRVLAIQGLDTRGRPEPRFSGC